MKKRPLFLLSLILISAVAVNVYFYLTKEVTLQFYAHPDKLGVMNEVITAFEAEHPRIHINYVELPDDTNDKFQIISAKLALQNGQIDVLDADVTWPSIFVKSNWVADLKPYFKDSEISEYLDSAVDAATVNEKLYGIPYRIDTGVLFYRSDLLEKYNKPIPTTYEELIQTSLEIQRQEPGLYGFAASWRNFEGLTCNFFELLWSAGYDLDTGQVPYAFDPSGLTQTLTLMQNMVHSDRIVPEESLNYSSGDLRKAFMSGKLLFMRDWPTGWRRLSEEPSLTGKFGVAPLPSIQPGHDSNGTFGGWMYMVSKDSKNKREAVTWIKYLTAYEVEKRMNLEYNYIPSRKALFSDADALVKMPFLKDLESYFNQSKSRPKVANYDALSLLLQSQIHLTLQNGQTPEQAVTTLETLIQKLPY